MFRIPGLASLAIGFILASGCESFKPEDPDMISDRLRPGPGLLSGAGGEFVLFRETPETPKSNPEQAPDS